MSRLAALLIAPLLLAGCAHDRAYGGVDLSLNARTYSVATIRPISAMVALRRAMSPGA
jgi:hypothetical protein